ncbi:MAG: hypothetical protein GQ470_00775 [Gammaproteobacteria bacterium]|nr:hypothetical protein [Gammaproteobacteria bacterium]
MAARNDYAKKPTSRGGARKTTRRKTGSKKPVPGWIWLLAGLSIGLFIAFLITISEQGVTQKPVASVQKKSPRKNVGRADPKPKKQARSSTGEGVKFDFYHILPEMEVEIPKDEIESGKKSDTPPTQYFIQVGSFKNPADAESRRAELFLLNFAPSLQTVTIDGRQSWHRVRLGPFIDSRKLDLAQRRLQNNDIDFITLKERK